MHKLLTIALFLLQSAAAGAAPESDAQDRDRIKNAVAGFIQQQTATLPGKTNYQIDDIDRRIVLPACASFDAFLPSGSQLAGKTSVGVRCGTTQRTVEARNDWSILVPVRITYTINLLTSARQLPPGHTLQEQDIASQEMETPRIEGFTDPRQVLGKVLRYGIGSGQMLREDMLRPPYSVRQGQVVPLAVQGEGFSIRSEGVALSNASEGQAVQIRVGSGRVVSGTARADGVVEIAP